jgi:pilus assembly protein CpaE
MTKYLLAFPDDAFNEVVSDVAALGDVVKAFSDEGALEDIATVCDEFVRFDPDVITVGPGISTTSALALITELDRRHLTTSIVLVHEPNADLWQDALRSGARDIIAPSAKPLAVETALQRAVDISQNRRESLIHAGGPRVAASPSGRIVTVTSPKGGSGKTVVATNVALSLAKRTPGNVVLVDLDLQFGDVASALGLVPTYTMYTATQASGSEAMLLKAFLTPHSSQLLVLCAPDDPTEADDVKEGDAVRIVQELAKLFQWVVVDTGAGLDDLTLSIAEVATDLVFVSSTDVPSVRGVRKELAIMDQLGVRATRHLILNRSDAKVGLSGKDIEDTMGMPITVEVPSTRAVPTSVNIGIPVVEHDPRSGAAKSLVTFASRLLESTAQPAPSKSWRGFLR